MMKNIAIRNAMQINSYLYYISCISVKKYEPNFILGR
jgi:hypothetical protein